MADGKVVRNLSNSWENVSNPLLHKLRYRVCNGICCVMVCDDKAYAFPAKNTWYIVGTLPVGARPNETMYGSWFTRDGVGGEVQITNDGNIHLNTNSATKQFISTTIAFPV